MTTGVAFDRGLLGLGRPDLAEHHDRVGVLPWRGGPGLLVEQLRAAGLTGRGGAGFPVARKLAVVHGNGVATRRAPVVVANGSEGEPASAKDRMLLRCAPHLVLDGLQLVAEATGATRAYAHVAPDAVAAVRAALAQREGLDRVPVAVHAAGAHFVAGEETAVVAALDGRRAVPTDKLRRVTEAGVGGRPTLVQNVETLAHVALIARWGSAWFRERGTAAEPGPLLVTVSGAVRRPGVFEIDHGSPLPEVLAAADACAAAAVLVGGFHGAWLAPDEVAAAEMSRASLARWSASPGAGVLLVLPPGASGLAETRRIVDYLAGQSSGQCLACVNGLPRMAAVLGDLAAGPRDPRVADDARRLAALVRGRGACHHPDGTARLVNSALRVFGGDP